MMIIFFFNSSLYFNFAGDPAGHHVIIVDDLVMTGGTLVQCAKVRIWFLEIHVIVDEVSLGYI